MILACLSTVSHDSTSFKVNLVCNVCLIFRTCLIFYCNSIPIIRTFSLQAASTPSALTRRLHNVSSHPILSGGVKITLETWNCRRV